MKIITLLLLILLISGCAATPEFIDECRPLHEPDEKAIAKCEKKVLYKEKVQFEQQEMGLKKWQCGSIGGIWIQLGSPRYGRCDYDPFR